MTATILFVDDEPDLEALVLQKFRRQIRDGAVTFVFAHDGIEALASLEASFPLLLGEGRIEEANSLLDELYEVVYAENFTYALDGALAMADLGRGEALRTATDRSLLGKPWRLVVDALVQSDYVTAADRYADVGARAYEAYSRSRAAKRLLDSGDEAAAAEQLGRALAFYRSVGATYYIREGEALLRASA